MAAIRATARASDLLYRTLPSVYETAYGIYKRIAERDAIAVVRQLVRPGDRVVDVGSNVGFYAELLARCVGPAGEVHAFEPDPTNYERLAARARRHPQIRAVRAAVTERGGTTDLYVSPHLNVDHRTYDAGEGRRRLRVDAIALDELFPRPEQTVRFVKLDIQGAERAALLGMRALLGRSCEVHVLLELWPFVHDRFGGGTMELLALLESFGFAIWRVGRGGALTERIGPGATIAGRDDADAYFDVLCVPAGRGDARAAC